MSNRKRILVVDDDFEILGFYKAALGTAVESFEVVGVPSGEEAILELMRVGYDLLIADIGLPGMSGYELVRKARTLLPTIRIVVVSAESRVDVEHALGAFTVDDIIEKPIETQHLLDLVNGALLGRKAPPAAKPIPESTAVGVDIADRLEMLQSDTSAEFVLFGTLSGKVAYSNGISGKLDIDVLAGNLANHIQASFTISQMIDGSDASSIQYITGKRHDVYIANVGLAHFMALFFPASGRRGRLGTIWVFVQRAIHDLLPLLDRPASRAAKPAPPIPTPEPVAVIPDPEPEPEPAVVDEPLVELPQTAALEPPPLPDSFTDVEEIADEADLELSFDAADLPLPDGFDDLAFDDDAGLDMWELDEEEEAIGQGLSMEEALKQGLIPGGFNSDSSTGE